MKKEKENNRKLAQKDFSIIESLYKLQKRTACLANTYPI